MSFSFKVNKTATVSSILILTILFSTFIEITIKNNVIDSIFVNSGDTNSKATIILDAGHGGEDCGAIGVTGALEKDLNLDITFLVGEILANNGYEVIYTRTEDKLLYTEKENIKGIRKISDLKNRVKISAEYSQAPFLSIHMNSFGDPKYSGLQVYYGTQNEKSNVLAKSIQDTVQDMIQPSNNRKIKKGDKIYLLKNIESPAVLIECGFLSNAEECEKLSEKEYQKSLSFAIVCGIIEYMSKNP